MPIIGGIKLSGKTGPWNIGVMDMVTDETTVYIDEKNGTRTAKAYPRTNYTVMRLKRDILAQSYIGLIGTSVYRADKPTIQETGTQRVDRFLNKQTNHMGGVDFSLRTSRFMGGRNLYLSGFLAASDTPGLDGNNVAGRGHAGLSQRPF